MMSKYHWCSSLRFVTHWLRGYGLAIQRFAFHLAFALALFFLWASFPVGAQVATPSLPLTPLGYCQLSPSTATKLSSCSGGIPTVPWSSRPANVAVIRTESQSIRYRDDGTAPTASVGQIVLTSDPPLIYVGTLSAIQIIQASASATVDVLFYYSP